MGWLCRVLVLSLAVLVAETWATRVDIRNAFHKRMTVGNPCRQPEKPFPCKTDVRCLPMRYVCDNNYDCWDTSDEDSDMCTALKRPPVEDIEAFLQDQSDWIIPELFGGRDYHKIAHALAVSQTLESLSLRLELGARGASKLRDIMELVRSDNEEGMEKFGMPPSAWNQVRYFFNALIKAGLD